jgi:hypothetical protein
MKRAFGTLTLASIAVAACASPPIRKASESEILAATKQLAANDCRPHDLDKAVHVSSCEYSLAFANGEWSVDVMYRMVDKSGKPVLPFGADAIYIFDSSGKFIKVIDGQ